MPERHSVNKKLYIPIFIAIIIVIIIIIWRPCITEKVTTVFLVRHADVDYSTNPSDPNLTPEGVQRANELKEVLSNVDIDAVYSTNTFRTKETAQPLATSKNLQITLYYNIDSLVNEVKQNHRGEEILIVGHADTVPDTINKFVGQNTGYSIGNEFYKIFIVALTESGKFWVVQLKYGEIP